MSIISFAVQFVPYPYSLLSALRHADFVAGHGRVNGRLERGVTGCCGAAVGVRGNVVRGG